MTINIDDLTIGQIKQLQALMPQNAKEQSIDPFIGQYVIVRTCSAGVFAGILKARYGNKITLENSRRLWCWHTANNGVSLSEVAVYGINQDKSKICCVEPIKMVEDIEVTPCSDAARKSIEGAKNYVA